jgi:hypothetical protein
MLTEIRELKEDKSDEEDDEPQSDDVSKQEDLQAILSSIPSFAYMNKDKPK